MERLRAEESRKTNFLPFTCDWVSVRVNNGDYGASKPTPVVSGQWIYTGTDTGTVLKISRADGVVISCISLLFSVSNFRTTKVRGDFRCRRSVKGIHGSPAADETNIYIGAYDGYLYAVNKETMKLAWDAHLGNWIGNQFDLFKCALINPLIQ